MTPAGAVLNFHAYPTATSRQKRRLQSASYAGTAPHAAVVHTRTAAAVGVLGGPLRQAAADSGGMSHVDYNDNYDCQRRIN